MAHHRVQIRGDEGGKGELHHQGLMDRRFTAAELGDFSSGLP